MMDIKEAAEIEGPKESPAVIPDCDPIANKVLQTDEGRVLIILQNAHKMMIISKRSKRRRITQVECRYIKSV
jgi:hypothetical protein